LGSLTREPRNPATYEDAAKGDKPGIWIYCASKALAEKAAFDYAKQHPELQMTTINRKLDRSTISPMIVDPSISVYDIRAARAVS
jgi:hypothetical protein